MNEPVRSTRNPRVVAANRLHRARERRATGRTLAEGPHVVAEAIAAGVAIVDLFVLIGDSQGLELAARAGLEATLVEDHVMARVAGTASPRGPVAVVTVPSDQPIETDAVVLEVTDPGNAGTIIRTAASFGLGVVTTGASTDLWSPKVLRAGAGAHFRTRIGHRGPEATIATVVDGGIAPWHMPNVLDRDRTWSLLVGSEPHGLAIDSIGAADVLVTIPLQGGVDSLNAAVAAGIVMYELARWRDGGPAYRNRLPVR